MSVGKRATRVNSEAKAIRKVHQTKEYKNIIIHTSSPKA